MKKSAIISTTVLMALSLFFFAETAVAQSTVNVNDKLPAGFYNYATQEWQPGAEVSSQTDTILNISNLSGGFLPLWQAGANPPLTPPQLIQDWAESNGGTVESFTIGYATNLPSPISIGMHFYAGTNDTLPGSLIGSYSMTNLPGSTSGFNELFEIPVNISDSTFSLNPGWMGYAYEIRDDSTGALTATGGGTDGYRVLPDLTNFTIPAFFGQFAISLQGTVFDSILFVDNSAPAGGDCTFLARCDSFGNALDRAFDGSSIFVYGGDGPYQPDFSTANASNLSLIGEGTGLTLGGFTIVPGDTFPTFGTSISLNIFNNVTGITVSGLDTIPAFSGKNVDEDVTITNVFGDSTAGLFSWNNSNGSLFASGFTARNVFGTAIDIRGGASTVILQNGAIEQNGGTAFLRIGDGHTGAFFSDSTVSWRTTAPLDTAGFYFPGAHGSYDIKGGFELPGPENEAFLGAVAITGGSTGTFTFNSRIEIINGLAFCMQNNTANVIYNGSLTGGFGIDNHSEGKVEINAPIDASGLGFGVTSGNGVYDFISTFCDTCPNFGIENSGGSFGFGTLQINNSLIDGIDIGTSNGTFTFGTVTLNKIAGDAFKKTNSNSDITIEQINIDGAQRGLVVTGGSFVVNGDGTRSTIQNVTDGILVNGADRVIVSQMDLASVTREPMCITDVRECVIIDDVNIRGGEHGIQLNCEEGNSPNSNEKFSDQSASTSLVDSLDLQIDNVSISNTASGGIHIQLPGSVVANMEITNNTVTTNGNDGLIVQTFDSSFAFVTLTGNDVSAASNDFVLTQDGSSTFQLAGFAGGDSAAVAAFLQENNVGTPSVGVAGTVSADPTTSVDEPDLPVTPTQFALSQNYPNPFNPETEIRFDLPVNAQVVLRIYNLLGEEVRELVNESLPPGLHEIRWDGKNDRGRGVASGIYLYRLQSGKFAITKRMLYLQ